MINIAFTGGGTGGHIYPGLAVAMELKKKFADHETRIFWIGSSAGMDRSIVEEAGIEFFGVPSGKLRRYFSLKNIVDLFKIAGGFFAARKILKKQKAVLLFSKGGFVSVPPCAAASSLGIRTFTHESDFSPGLATKINVRYVLRTGGWVFTAYEDTKKFFSEKTLKRGLSDRVTVTGNPVRAGFYNADAAKGRAFLGLSGNDVRILLVLGGSQGATEINELIRAILPELTKVYTVVHQTGPNLSWDIPASQRYKPYPYIKEDMPHVMAAAELVMGRSGAGIWEWAVLGKPMLLIPLRGSGTRGDQVENARFFNKAGAAFVLGEKPDTNELMTAINELANDTEKRKAMAVSSGNIGKSGGAQKIAGFLLQEIDKIKGKNNEF
ncbi:MAG: undecaprenyldiphospho-muramoylpentapeptide beta-N-acetylglucosaminyltransferase [Treponema sp.]|jgi:UDP-N-acetylglucosamine--N-acetylmuramyl-(pentapeptide) pyrophosphoryl-undecaprenol N-acetylglucosamine transferase|nr:undecaprenyldiphospho-muramoylpentapeptide beta-N-acetylglucosaminyltransferase [Treponema sp.]